MYLIHKHNGLKSCKSVILRLLHHVLNLLDSAGNSAEINKGGFCPMGNNAGKRGFTDTRRSPEDHRGDHILIKHAPKYLALSHKMLLTNIVIQCFRAKSAGKGCISVDFF